MRNMLIISVLIGFLVLSITAQDTTEVVIEDTVVTYNPRPNDISLPKMTSPQYKFYVHTAGVDNHSAGVLEERYRAEQVSHMGPSKSKGAEKGSQNRRKAQDESRMR